MIAKNYKELISTLLPDAQQDLYFLMCQKPLKKSLTINPTKISPKAFEQFAKENSWILEKHPFLKDSYSYYIDRDDTSIALGNHWMHQCGFFYIQEIAASTPAYLLNLPSNGIVLDIAASPGGKTSQLANKLQMIGNIEHQACGLIIANDVDTLRIRTLSENLRRMGCWNTVTSKLDGTKRGDTYPELFDAILVDAPCSGEGTGFKSDDALTHWRMEEIRKISGLQLQILRSAIYACKVGGEILYSTCTLNTLENEGVLAQILKEFSGSIELEQISSINTEIGYTIDGFSETQATKVGRFWPHLQKTGGFFVSKLKKVETTALKKAYTEHMNHKKGKENKQVSFYGTYQSPEIKRIKQLLKEYYGIELDPKRFLLFMQGDICFITSPLVLTLPFQNISTGIPLGKLVRDTRVATHYLGACLGHLATKNVISISSTQAQEYVDSEGALQLDTHLQTNAHPFFILQRQGTGIGTVKWVQGVWKSKCNN